jgi:hypothetical protein
MGLNGQLLDAATFSHRKWASVPKEQEARWAPELADTKWHAKVLPLPGIKLASHTDSAIRNPNINFVS